MDVSTALFQIDMVKQLEEKTRKIFKNMDALSKEKLEIIGEIGIDKDYIQDVFIKLSHIREFYEKDLGSQKINCKW